MELSKTKLIAGPMVIFLVVVSVLVIKFNYDLNNSMRLDIDARKYKGAEFISSPFISRSWMSVAMEISKKENLAPANSARFYSYVASVFSDVLEATFERGEASQATSDLISYMFPGYDQLTKRVLEQQVGGELEYALSSKAREILEEYKNRSRTDGYDLVWDGNTPEGKWYIRDNKTDKGAMAGHWKPWIFKPDSDFSVPEPPKEGSLWDRLEIEVVEYAVDNRKPEDLHSIYAWHGASGFEKGSAGDNITPAGVWQNILFVEKGGDIKEREYARAQKLLAQSIADSFIQTWKVKYEYWTKRPSMKIPDLNLAVGDPPFPSYVSGHSAISATAATVLSSLFPDKRKIWEKNAQDARNSRLLAGIHFDADNKAGFSLGQKIGREVLKNLGADISIKSYKPRNSLQAAFGIAMIKIKRTVNRVEEKFVTLLARVFHEPNGFTNAIGNSGIDKKKPMAGVSAADYDGDGWLDIFLAGNGLYRNNGDGTFLEVTDSAGIRILRSSGEGQGDKNSAGIFGDLNNDGCSDLYLSNFAVREDTLYFNNCDGTFRDVTTAAGIKGSYHGQGVAMGDYNKDGFLDIYVANIGLSGSAHVLVEPNLLYRNNGNGTFTEVGERAAVRGAPRCEEVKNIHNPLGVVDKGTSPLSKASYQPIWFDYNNDSWPDLFVATDFGVSPLYRNNGDGTFTEVTQEAGMCVRGTGMGVTAGDYDGDGDLDLYVTNVGQNFLWRNNGDGTFLEVSEGAGAANWESLGWGTEFLDYDNDSDPDLYAVNGTVSGATVSANVVLRKDKLYKNDGKGSFKDVARTVGITGNDPKLAAAVGDFNNDGFEDIFVGSEQGRIPDSDVSHRLYMNKGNGNNWLTLKLVGTESNRDAVGARITLKVGGKSQVREVISGSSFLSQRSLWQTFGLGSSKKADSIEIRWPSGKVQTLADLESNQTLTVNEAD